MHHFFHIQADSVISRNQDKTGYTDISDDRNRNINPGANPFATPLSAACIQNIITRHTIRSSSILELRPFFTVFSMYLPSVLSVQCPLDSIKNLSKQQTPADRRRHPHRVVKDERGAGQFADIDKLCRCHLENLKSENMKCQKNNRILPDIG